MTAFHDISYEPSYEQKALAAMANAVEHGINFFDTVCEYQPDEAKSSGITAYEDLLGKAIKIHGRDKFVIAVKFDAIEAELSHQSSCNLRLQVDDALRRLGVDNIDLYYHRHLDPNTPLEETMGCLKSLVKAG